MLHAMTTTTFALEGYRVTRNIGIVRGITVRSRSIFGSIGGSLQTIIGGNITLFTELCEKSREADRESGQSQLPITPARWGPTRSSACAMTPTN